MFKHRFLRATTLVSLSVSIALPISCYAQDSDWPTRPITMIVPASPGNTQDFTGRLLADKLSRRLGQTVIVENRPSVGGIAAARHVASAAANGYTLFYAGTAQAITQVIRSPSPYNMLEDFSPIASVSSSAAFIVVDGKNGYKNYQEFLDAAKSKGSGMMLGIGLLASFQHLSAELLKFRAGLDYTIVPFRSATNLATALRAQDINAAIEFSGPTISLIKDGSLRVLATVNSKRSKLFPDIPSISEMGIKGMDVMSWSMLFARKGTPEPIIRRLNQEIQGILKDPDFVQSQATRGATTLAGSPEDARSMLETSLKTWADVISSAKITIQ